MAMNVLDSIIISYKVLENIFLEIFGNFWKKIYLKTTSLKVLVKNIQKFFFAEVS